MNARGSDVLTERARALASSEDPESLARLADLLRSRGFLDGLDRPQALLGPPDELRLSLVLDELAGHPRADLAHPVLIALCDDPVFTAAAARVELLILALVEVRPSPPRAVAFWDRHCRPCDGFANLTAGALLDNGSEPAVALFERKLLDEGHAERVRRAWLIRHVPRHRGAPLVVACCERLLRADLPRALALAVVASLLHDDPETWSGLEDVEGPPRWEEIGAEASAGIVRLGESAWRSPWLDARLRQVVRRRLDLLHAPRSPGLRDAIDR